MNLIIINNDKSCVTDNLGNTLGHILYVIKRLVIIMRIVQHNIYIEYFSISYCTEFEISDIHRKFILYIHSPSNV